MPHSQFWFLEKQAVHLLKDVAHD